MIDDDHHMMSWGLVQEAGLSHRCEKFEEAGRQGQERLRTPHGHDCCSSLFSRIACQTQIHCIPKHQRWPSLHACKEVDVCGCQIQVYRMSRKCLMQAHCFSQAAVHPPWLFFQAARLEIKCQVSDL